MIWFLSKNIIDGVFNVAEKLFWERYGPEVLIEREGIFREISLWIDAYRRIIQFV